MIKTAVKLMFSLFGALIISLNAQAKGGGVNTMFTEHHTFIATLLVESEKNSVAIWALPFPSDDEGLKKVKELFSKNKHGDYKRKHSLFRFIPASIKFGFSDDVGQIESSFNDDLRAEIMAHYSEKDVALVCFGVNKDGVPLCEAYDAEDTALNQGIVRKGFAIYSKENAIENKEYNDLIIHAQDAAKEEKVGVWVPFHFMLHNISR